MSVTYREAWGLFQVDQQPPTTTIHDDSSAHQDNPSRSSSDSLYPTAGPVSNSSEQNNATPNSEISAELRRLRHDLRQLRYSNGVAEEPREVMTQMSVRLDQLTSALRSDPSVLGTVRPNLIESNTNPPQIESFRCREPCCSGRRLFSSRSNLIRHQRERRGQTVKLRCSFCDAVFTRSSARNAHEAARRCRKP